MTPRFTQVFLLSLTVSVFGFELASCATTGDSAKKAAALDPKSAEGMYARAVVKLQRGQVTEAQQAFNELKAAHPYSRFTALADLRLADGYMKREELIEAIDLYRTFLRFHPSHSEAPYALFQIGEAQMAQIPQAWFFMVPATEKDQDATRAAITAYEAFLKQESSGARAERAQAQIGVCTRRLAEHEMYVARFYAKRGHPDGAWLRAEAVLKAYPNVGLEPEALYIAGKARLEKNCTDEGQAHLQRLLQDYPKSTFAVQARTSRLGVSAKSTPVQ